MSKQLNIALRPRTSAVPPPNATAQIVDSNGVSHSLTNSNTNYTFEDNVVVHLTATANTGYYFTNPPYLQHTNATGQSVQDPFTTDDVGSYPVNYYMDFNTSNQSQTNSIAYVFVTDTAEGGGTDYSYTTNLTNCTCSLSGGTLSGGVATPITFTAASGYEFTTAPTITNGTLSVTPLTNLTYSGTVTLTGNNAVITATTSALTTGYFNTVLNNCSCTLSPNELNINQPYDIAFYPALYYSFATAPSITSGNGILTLEQSLNGYSGTITLSDYNGVTVTATATETPIETYHFETSLTNATTNISASTEYELGDEVNIIVTASEGYYFSTAPYLSYSYNGVQVNVPLSSDDVGDYKSNYYIDFTIIECTNNTITLHANGQVIPEVDKYGIITMYNPTPNELREIGNVRYMGDIDLGNYISNLIKVYVEIPQGNTANVLLGGYNTNVSSNVVVNDVVETDCDTVQIVGNYNNSMDYDNTTVEIYLPLIGFQTLDTTKVMNQTLHLIYRTNVINGDTIACIYNTIGTLIYTFNANASFEIPYRLNAELEAHGKLEVNSNYLFGFTPFVTVRRNLAYNTASTTANDDRLVTLSSLTGLVRCSEVFNTIQATTAEKNEIDNLLKGGVIL